MSVSRFEIVPTGGVPFDTPRLSIEAGWDTEGYVEAVVLLKLVRSIKSARIAVDFIGTVTSNWEPGGRLVSKTSKEIVPYSKQCIHLSETLYESASSSDVLTPNVTGASQTFNFKFRLPRSQLPPTFSCSQGSVSYVLKATLSYQDGIFSRKTMEAEMPVQVNMPETAKVKALGSPSPYDHTSHGTPDNAGFQIMIPSTVVRIGDIVNVSVTIMSTPGSAKLRLMHTSLRLLQSFTNPQGFPTIAKTPRPLGESSFSFPMVRVGNERNMLEPIVRLIQLLVDPELAKPSFDSSLISIKTVFRLELTLDTSETPNISFDAPITVILPTKSNYQNEIFPKYIPSQMQQQMSQQMSPQLPRNTSVVSNHLDSSRASLASRGYTSPPISPVSAFRTSSKQNQLDASGGMNPPLYDAANLVQSPQFIANQLENDAKSRVYSNNTTLVGKPSSLMRDIASLDINGGRSISDKNSFNYDDYVQGTSAGYRAAGRPDDGISVHSGSSFHGPNDIWTVQMVADWVKTYAGASDEVVKAFVDNEIDGSVLLTLSVEDLKTDLKVSALGVRRKIEMAIDRSKVVGRGKNFLDGTIVVEAGWDTEAVLEGAVLLKVGNKLKSVRIQAELRGYVETRWSVIGGKLNEKPESESNKISRSARVFQQIVEVVYDSSDPIYPTAAGRSHSYPFTFKLPRNTMPPSYESFGGSIQYYIKCSMFYQEGMKLLKSSVDFEVPVTVTMPRSALLKLISSPSNMVHQGDVTADKVQFSVETPRRIVSIGETFEMYLRIISIPEGTRLRLFNASLRTVAQYLNQDGRGATAKFPRPLAEASETFPLIQVQEPLIRSLKLIVDKEIGQCSFESSLISVKTIFRLEIILSDSETPNISYEVPIVVLPALSGPTFTHTEAIMGLQQPMQFHQQMDRAPRAASSLQYDRPTPANLPMRVQSYEQHEQQIFYPAPVTGNSLYSSSSSETGGIVGYTPSSRSDSMNMVHPIRTLPQNSIQSAVPAQNVAPLQPYSSCPAPRQPTVSSPQTRRQTERNRSFSSGAITKADMSSYAVDPILHPTLPAYEESVLPPIEPVLRDVSTPVAITPAGAAIDAKINDLLAEIEALEQSVAEKTALLSETSIPRNSESPNGFARRIFSGSSSGSAIPPIRPSDSVSERSGSAVTGNTANESWSVQAVADWAKQIGCSAEVCSSFVAQEIDGHVLMTLTDADLRNDLGISSLGVRRKIVMAIEKLNQVVEIKGFLFTVANEFGPSAIPQVRFAPIVVRPTDSCAYISIVSAEAYKNSFSETSDQFSATHLQVEAGWSDPALLNCVSILHTQDKLLNVRVIAELKGTATVLNERSSQTLSSQFLRISEAVYESDSVAKGPPLFMPFKFKLPAKIPHSFEIAHKNCSVRYQVVVTMTYLDLVSAIPLTLVAKQTLRVLLPEAAKLQMLLSPSPLVREMPDLHESGIFYSIIIPKNVISIGDQLELTVTIHSVAPNVTLKSLKAQAVSVIMLNNSTEQSNQFDINTLSEITQKFGADIALPTSRKLFLDMEKNSAIPSVESSLFSVNTVLRLQFVVIGGVWPRDNKRSNLEFIMGLAEKTVCDEFPINLIPSLGTRSTAVRSSSILDSPLSSNKSPDPRPSSLSLPDAIVSATDAPTAMKGALSESGESAGNGKPMRSQPRITTPSSASGNSAIFSPSSSFTSTSGAAPSTWSVPMVMEWLLKIGAPERTTRIFEDCFAEHGIDGLALMTLTENDLKDELHIEQLGVRRKILAEKDKIRSLSR
ncbi:hypothetical protein HDU82_002719 [Entophlyctis luteolus]|nr:hypothetical protein HDU82_002719 [Entophlyctis luteolus]